MAATSPHNKIITKVVRESFKPLGIVQKGKSRMWYDDHGYFATFIEFQPDRWRQGTFLNAAIHFMWQPIGEAYISYDYAINHAREIELQEYVGDDIAFANTIRDLCRLSIERVEEYRKFSPFGEYAVNRILNHEFVSDGIWGARHRAIVYGLIGDTKNCSVSCEKSIHDTKADLEWLKDGGHNIALDDWRYQLIEEMEEMPKIAKNGKSVFEKHVLSMITEHRKSLKLPEREITLVSQR